MTKSSAEILAEVRAVLAEHLGISTPVSADTDLARDLSLDSIEQLVLLAEIEERFGTTLDLDDNTEIVTLGDLMRRLS
ncbi:MAG: acyl carrier protein [Candidatus Schekmanbacteria bacterium]|nr:acyl carrier protein [Candidatus Schekmanbacteria bacterium]